MDKKDKGGDAEGDSGAAMADIAQARSAKKKDKLVNDEKSDGKAMVKKRKRDKGGSAEVDLHSAGAGQDSAEVKKKKTKKRVKVRTEDKGYGKPKAAGKENPEHPEVKKQRLKKARKAIKYRK